MFYIKDMIQLVSTVLLAGKKNLATILREPVGAPIIAFIILTTAIMKKGNKKDTSNKKISKLTKTKHVENDAPQIDVSTEEAEPVNNIGEIPGKGFGRLLGCG
jgi:hypothetical protein